MHTQTYTHICTHRDEQQFFRILMVLGKELEIGKTLYFFILKLKYQQ